MKIVAFHGSPGTPLDFIGLKNTFSEGTLCAPARPGFEGLFKGDDLPERSEELLVLGYSFGCAEAVRFAATSESHGYQVKALLLIAPYLFPKNDFKSKLKNTVISLPGLGHKLLQKAAKTSIDELLVHSSYPLNPPPEYREAAEKYRTPQILRRVVLEKSDPSFSIPKNLSTLKSRKLPVGLVYGDQDLSSPVSEQIAPLRALLPIAFEEVIAHAGHALLWTHVTPLSELIRRKYL